MQCAANLAAKRQADRHLRGAEDVNSLPRPALTADLVERIPKQLRQCPDLPVVRHAAKRRLSGPDMDDLGQARTLANTSASVTR